MIGFSDALILREIYVIGDLISENICFDSGERERESGCLSAGGEQADLGNWVANNSDGGYCKYE
jgi:hypothetical protein